MEEVGCCKGYERYFRIRYRLEVIPSFQEYLCFDCLESPFEASTMLAPLLYVRDRGILFKSSTHSRYCIFSGYNLRHTSWKTNLRTAGMAGMAPFFFTRLIQGNAYCLKNKTRTLKEKERQRERERDRERERETDRQRDRQTDRDQQNLNIIFFFAFGRCQCAKKVITDILFVFLVINRCRQKTFMDSKE